MTLTDKERSKDCITTKKRYLKKKTAHQKVTLATVMFGKRIDMDVRIL